MAQAEGIINKTKQLRTSQAGWLTKRVNKGIEALSRGRSKSHLHECIEAITSTLDSLSDANELYKAQLTEPLAVQEAQEWFEARKGLAIQTVEALTSRYVHSSSLPTETQDSLLEEEETESFSTGSDSESESRHSKNSLQLRLEKAQLELKQAFQKAQLKEKEADLTAERMKQEAEQVLEKAKLKTVALDRELKASSHRSTWSKRVIYTGVNPGQLAADDKVHEWLSENHAEQGPQLVTPARPTCPRSCGSPDFVLPQTELRDSLAESRQVPQSRTHYETFAPPQVPATDWRYPVESPLNPLAPSFQPHNNTLDGWIDCLPTSTPKSPVAPRNLENATAMNMMPELVSSLVQINTEKSLPSVTIPKFDGTAIQWPKFISLFEEKVHSKPGLSDSRKMDLLLSYLDGDAKKFVEGIGYNGSHYVEVLTELKKHFGHRKRVAKAYLERVTTGNRIPEGNPTALRQFYVAVRDCISTLSQLGYQSDLFGTDALSRASKRIPRDKTNSWNRYITRVTKCREPTLFDLRNWLDDCIATDFNPYAVHPQKQATQEKSRTIMKTTTQEPKAKSTGATASGSSNSKYSKPKEGTTSVSNSSSVQFNKKYACPLCKEHHFLYRCSVFQNKTIPERWRDARDNRVCFNCLKPHMVDACSSKVVCKSPACGKKHHTLLHQHRDGMDERKSDNTAVVSSATTRQAKGQQVYFQLVPVNVYGQNGTVIETVALLDSASEITIMRDSLAKDLGLKGTSKSLNLQTLNSNRTVKSSIVTFRVKAARDPNAELLTVKRAWTVDQQDIYCPTQRIQHSWEHLKDLGLKDIESSEVQILIGIDNPEVHIQSEIRYGKANQPLGVKGPLGWSIMGVAEGKQAQEISKRVNIIRAQEADIQDKIEAFWRTESFGTAYQFDKETSVEDMVAMEMLQKSTKLVNGHYEVGMLWREEPPKLENNISVAQRRYYALEKRLRKDESFKEKYAETLNGYISKGHARKLTKEEARETSDKTWYIPHHGVTSASKPGKVRVVYDAAAEFHGRSLNDALLKGPDLLNNLFGILQRFRLFDVALVADIEGMYHQVHVPESDADALRFLWKEQIDSPGPPETFKMSVHIFGAGDSPACCIYALHRAALDNKKEYREEVVNTVLTDFYMDDLMKSLEKTPESLKLPADIIAILSKGGFRVCKWLCTDSEMLQTIPESERAMQPVDLELKDGTTKRALGVKWCIEEDSFAFSYDLKPGEPTKRGVISVVCSLFDPCGFISPYVMRAKFIIQEIWRAGLDWDDRIPENLQKRWRKWLTELDFLRSYRIPRHHTGFSAAVTEISLQVFADASEQAFGSVAYLRYTTSQGDIVCSFLASKTRVAPIKPQLTIPRLELQGAVLAVRLAKMIERELHIVKLVRVFWTDSTTVLAYIRNDKKRFKPFVANRIAEIRDSSAVEEWRHVPTSLNPADYCTRDTETETLLNNTCWFQGPDFLQKTEEHWPQSVAVATEIEENDPEIKASACNAVKGIPVSAQEEFLNKLNVQSLVAPENFSSWQGLVRRTAWIIRAVRNFAAGIKRLGLTALTCKEITAEEYQESANCLIGQAQREEFHTEWEILVKGNQLPAKNSLLALQPFHDGGLLRVGGRLRKAKLTTDAKHQILLPQRHVITRLLVSHVHVRNAHCGREHLIAELRQQYWPINARNVAKQAIFECLYCRLRRLKPVTPKMADLPECRLDASLGVFYYTGVDYWGPMYVMQRRSVLKRWGCLFTCLSTRAVHIELAESLETDDFIMCLRRFMGRRGQPKHIHSDNGTNFVGANTELKQCLTNLNQSQIVQFLSPKGIAWHFNPPAAPHFGGAWEALVKSVKVALKAVLSGRHIQEPVLRTVLVEVEAVINSRPLSYNTTDIDDLSVITPNHFLIGRANNMVAPDTFLDKEVNSRRRWRQAQVLINHVCRRWVREYLPTLTIRKKWLVDGPCVAVGDLVLLVDESAPRGHWEMARVLELFPGDDGIVRACKVKTSKSEFVRPVAKVCVLEESVQTSET